MTSGTRLSDKVALITGAARGLGEAEARRFAQEGASVIVADVLERGQDIADGICNEGGEAIFIELDVTDEHAWQSAIDVVVDEFDRLDVLVNNAGIARGEAIDEETLEGWNKVVSVNQTGTFLGMRESLPLIAETGGGSVINTASVWGVVGAPDSAAYQATKGAVRTMTKNAAIAFAEQDVRVNAICPGLIQTPIVENREELISHVKSRTPMSRSGTPREIADAALFLASNESSFVTGTELFVDGGYTAQ